MKKIKKQTFSKHIGPIIENALERKKRAAKSKKADSVSFDDLLKYDIVKNFMIEKGLKLYGGYAINVSLPHKIRFYSEYEIPDYDAFSPTPWKHATQLADKLYAAGYKYTEVKEAIHHGTFKVYANMWPVADISYKPKLLYDAVKTHQPFGERLNIVTPTFLKISMYQELSSPLIDPGRWEKIGWRLLLLEQYEYSLQKNKDAKKQCGKKYTITKINKHLGEALSDHVQQMVHTFFKKNKIVRSGFDAVNFYFAQSGIKPIHLTIIDGISSKAEEHAEELKKVFERKFKDAEVTMEKIEEGDIYDITAVTYAIKVQDFDIQVNISQLEQCATVVSSRGYAYTSLSLIKYLLYIQVVYEQDEETREMYQCIIYHLDKAARTYYRAHSKTPFNQSPFSLYTTTCIGPYQNVKNVRRVDMWKQKTEQFKEGRTLFPKDDKVCLKNVKGKQLEIKSKVVTSPECSIHKNKKDCSYPCSWKRGVCGVLPPAYKPEWEKIRKKPAKDFLTKS